MLDVTIPLSIFRRIKDDRGRGLQIRFAYERLLFFCFARIIMDTWREIRLSCSGGIR